MAERDVRISPREVAAFLELDPSEDEIDLVLLCLELLRDDPNMGDAVPFDPYQDYPSSRAIDCGRFLIVYSFDERDLNVVEILPYGDYDD